MQKRRSAMMEHKADTACVRQFSRTSPEWALMLFGYRAICKSIWRNANNSGFWQLKQDADLPHYDCPSAAFLLEGAISAFFFTAFHQPAKRWRIA